ncbi:L-lysine 2,3-aminomutase (EF-P beta-lysylation pathway) [Desulfocicer vacuolatum DSM 3385]|uniref:L-lysine 2,3-aminomutase (EF-P beta-lysylation pathway) n=1 Tax=Desulfocicer vacuolatum DSM 3385 TaxID=1121400 RepID=A0A1W2E5C7_9BACT|nr:radical SAM protein [Desulfocicer vacuolatum]SMD04526.1 L-lysine 2,3-aminomutase (EF-P beta-lysylation pathway) [Desulfocicer vacuolatum DSM 3385]
MKENLDGRLTIRFEHSKKEADVPLSTLVDGAVKFLEFYGNAQFCGREFIAVTGQGNGKTKLAALLGATGYEADAMGFFSAVFGAIGSARAQHLVVNEITIPHMLLVALLERVIPGHGYLSIKNPQRLEVTTNLDIPDDRRGDLQKVMDKYPVRLSRHTIRQMMVSRDVAYQYMPFVEELGSVGHVNTWIGQFHEGLLEQMYQNRVIFLLNMSCPVYCRFCFRKHKESRNENNPTVEDVKAAVKHVADSPSIKEIVVTGGDPFLNRANMAATIDGLMAVDHVQTLRLATRSVAYYPDLFLENEKAYLKYLKQKSLELQQNGKRMELATHFIHPDEVSPEALDIISDLVKNGIAVYIQTPFLSDCNDTGPELVKLFHLLRGAGAELHYIYIPCSPIHGNSIYWKSLSDGIYMAKHLRAHLSDRVMPRICTATPIGKMDWHTSGWAVERVADNENFVWIRTPYTPAYFKVFAPLTEKLTNIRTNAEGTIDIQYMAKIGDDSLLLGERPVKVAPKNALAMDADVSALKEELIATCQTDVSMVETNIKGLSRLHETRVLVDADGVEKEALAYIAEDSRITDVVVTAREDAMDSLYVISKFVRQLQDISHVNAVRLRSMAFATSPEIYTLGVVNTLGDLNRLSVVNPLRLEIETWFVQDQEVQPIHAAVARRLNNKGITVYANVPLLGGVNDTDTAIHDLAYVLRRSGIEFHHLYVAGLPVQGQWNIKHPVDSYDVIDIATMVRREGSGREIPRYIIATPLGEVDYGLTSQFIRQGDALKIKLTCYDTDYYRSMDPRFCFPKGVDQDLDGHPVMELPGFVKTNDFPIS